MVEVGKVSAKTSNQDVNIQNREKVRITGVNDVIGFDESFVDIDTELGKMIIRGEGLKIASLSLEQHELIVNGYVYSCEYEDISKNKKSIMGRMFR